MSVSNSFLIKGTAWTLGAFGFGQALQFISNVILTHLLAPEIFGIMVIINSVRNGVELVTDIGTSQNLVQNKNAETPEFYNTVWTLRVIRSVCLWIACLCLAIPLAHYYALPLLAFALPVTALSFIIAAFGTVSLALLQKRIRYVRLNIFSVVLDLITISAQLLLAYFIPNVWALVLGIVVTSASYTIASYFVLPEIRHRFLIERRYVRQILSFGKWVFFSSVAFFFAMNFDRLYFAKVEVLSVVGIYGIARALAELANAVIQRLCSYIVFPLIAQLQRSPRNELRKQLASKRLVLLLLGAAGVVPLTAFGDLVIRLLYDQRYQEAGWMLPILAIGVWFSLLANLNQSTLLGFGKPSYAAVADGLKFTWLLIGLPIGFTRFGILGGVIVVASSDLVRYFPILLGQMRERFSFATYDFVVSLTVLGLIGVFEWARWMAGFGTSFDALPFAFGHV